VDGSAPIADCLVQLRGALDQVGRQLSKLRAQHVNGRRQRDTVRAVVGDYFGTCRPNILRPLDEEQQLAALDQTMQDLLRCAQGRSTVSKYRALVRDALTELNRLERTILGSSTQLVPSSRHESRESRIIETLKRVIPSAAVAYEQALNDLRDQSRRSWYGTIAELRQALWEPLNKLAPDEEVRKAPWFQPERDQKKPTMAQKVVFILRSRKQLESQIKPAKQAGQSVEEYVGSLFRAVYDRASAGVHTPPERNEAVKVKGWVTEVLAEVLEVKE